GVGGVREEGLSRLPPKYRAPRVLCYLEGQTQEEVARRLGCPRKTVTTRLARACERLRPRLTRRGVSLPAGAVAAVLSEQGAASAGPAAPGGAPGQAPAPVAARGAAPGVGA